MRCTTSAPLPFTGQKRMWVKDLIELLSSAPEPTIVVDIFGGSGLLSRLAKDLYPSAHVVYNDYDNYTDRLHHIEDTERLRQEIVQILAPVKRNARVPDHLKECVLQAVRVHGERYYVDWLTLSSWILFTNRYARSVDDLVSLPMYNQPSRTALAGADASARYLQGLDIVHTDWRVLLDQYRDTPNVLYILDPPYLSTELGGYKSGVWRCDDYIDLFASFPSARYLYFSSSKFDFVPFLRRTSERLGCYNPFVGAQELRRVKQFGSGGRNPEVLYYRLKCKKEDAFRGIL